MNEHLFAAFHGHESRILSTLIRQKSGERASRTRPYLIPKTLACQYSYTHFFKWTAAFARKSANLSTLLIRKISNERDPLFCQHIFLKKPHTAYIERTGVKKSPHIANFLYTYYSSIWYNINIKRREKLLTITYTSNLLVSIMLKVVSKLMFDTLGPPSNEKKPPSQTTRKDS